MTTITPGQSHVPVPPTLVAEKNTIGTVGFVTSLVGTIFSVIPGWLILGWVTLPAAFILSLVGLFSQGKKKGLSIAGLIISVVGTIIAVLFALIGFVFIVDSSMQG